MEYSIKDVIYKGKDLMLLKTNESMVGAANTISRMRAKMSQKQLSKYDSEGLKIMPFIAIQRRREAIDNAYIASLGASKNMRENLCIGSNYKLDKSNTLRINVKQRGTLPEFLQDDRLTNIYLRVNFVHEEEESFKEVCVVKRGKQLEDVFVDIEKVTTRKLKHAKIFFSLSFVTRRFFKKQTTFIQRWTATMDSFKVMNGHCDWCEIKRLH
ncbi:hypothetical protein DPMN_052262 [Dreissena polymorpha]|uniref:Uncharacterized protein n=1 Tax=Dreissena polymorpha TaxID=45954 RepID=A0A9D4HP58_DREPO|nr:hypothetical protein DPMN_052262 [Dreissena polymorpha]